MKSSTAPHLMKNSEAPANQGSKFLSTFIFLSIRVLTLEREAGAVAEGTQARVGRGDFLPMMISPPVEPQSGS